MNLRKILAIFMTAAVMLCGMGLTASADDSVVAVIGFADGSWSAQDWASSCVVTGDGTYTITANCLSGNNPVGGSGISVMTVNFDGLSKRLGSAASGITVSDIKIVTGGGASLAIDQSKVLVGDLETNGNLRIEVYNAYGRTTKVQNYDPSVSPVNPDDFSFGADEQFKITFTIKGLDAALAGGSAETTTATEAPVETTTTTEATTAATTTTTEATTTTTTEAATTTTEAVTEETTAISEETTEETAEETEAETTTTTAAVTTTTTEAETTTAETTTAAPATTKAVEQAVASSSDNFASRNSQLMIFAIAAVAIIVAVIIAFVIIAVKKKK